MKWPTGLLLCAGKQLRFHSKLPKALQPFFLDGPCALDFALEAFRRNCEEVFVVVNSSCDSKPFLRRIASESNVHLLPVASGRGDAHAIYEAFHQLGGRRGSSALVGWGDAVFHDFRFISQIASDLDTSDLLIPVVFEQRPYVKIVFDEITGGVIQVQQSKFGQWDELPGWHDLSCFSLPINPYMNEYSRWSRAPRDEYSFMTLIQERKNLSVRAVPITDGTQALAFNDLAEHQHIARRLFQMESS